MTEHSAIDERGLLSGYVTDSLDQREREEFEDHMAECEVCTRESREFAEAFAELTFATQLAPPLELREAVLGAIARVRPLPAEDRPRHALGPVPSSPLSPMSADEVPTAPAAAVATVSSLELARARRGRRVLALAVAAVAVVALALGGWVVNARQQIQQQQVVADQQAQLNRTIDDLIASNDATVYPVELQNGSRASYVVSKSRDQAVLIAPDVAALPADRLYQLWTTGNGEDYRSAGTFSGSGAQRILINGNVEDTRALAITVEPSNGGVGSTAPTITDPQPFGIAPIPA